MSGILATATTKVRLVLKRVGQLPGARVPVIRLWNMYEYLAFVTHIRQNLRATRVDASIDPYSLYWVPPQQIKEMSRSTFDFIADTARIVDGSWDQDPRTVQDGAKYEQFEQVFCYDVPWEQTDYYNQKVQQIRNGQSNRYASVEEFVEKLRQYERMYNAFETGNYKLQSELVTENKKASLGDGGRALFPSLTDYTLIRHEIAVNIGRDGTLLRNDGRHRLALALLAGLDEVPVRIVVRHTEWQQLRDKVAQAIDEGLDNGVPAEQIHDHIEHTLGDELEPVALGLEHPDLKIIFERRLSGHDPT